MTATTDTSQTSARPWSHPLPSKVGVDDGRYGRVDALKDERLSAGLYKTQVIGPPDPPTNPPSVEVSPNPDSWHEITSGKGDKAFTWRVQVRPYPEAHFTPVAEGSGFVLVFFEGIDRETLIKILDIYNVSVDEQALERLQGREGLQLNGCVLIPENWVLEGITELGWGRFSAAAAVESIFARLSDRTS
ncbi:MAG: hypothetical protein EBZ48_03065 [Proteobacteria bacterium]|nr:hypothetical protein [Pseudomonadota bacterium]